MKYAGSIIITYKKGVMAAGLGESHKSKKKKKEKDYLQINLLKSYEEIKKKIFG